MVSDAVLTAGIVAIAGLAGPALMHVLASRTKRRELADHNKRLDDVRDQAAEAARLLVASDARATRDNKVTNGKLDVIHTLVNSNTTTLMRNEFDAITREAALMREVVTLNKAAGHQPSAATIAAIEATDRKIRELETALADRSTQDVIVEKQTAGQ